MDLINKIIAYEAGELTEATEIVKFFGELIASGLHTQQGHYGKAAANFIAVGWISPEGDVDWDAFNTAWEAA